MANSIIMPKAGMAMEEGVILRWLKNEGDTVEKGTPLLEIETDKTTMEVEAEHTGILIKIVAGGWGNCPRDRDNRLHRRKE